MTTSLIRLLLAATCWSSVLVQSKKLTKESLKELAGSEFNLFVNFHSPRSVLPSDIDPRRSVSCSRLPFCPILRCPQCVALQPTWSALTKLVEEDAAASRSTIIASVDCTEENDVCNKEAVRGYPTLKIFRAHDASGTEYDGPRDLSSLLELLQKQLGLSIEKPVLKKEPDSPAPSKATFVVQSLSWQDLMEEDGDETHEDPVLNREDDIRPEIPEPISGLYELSDENYKKFLSKGRHFVKFFTPWCGHCQKLEPAWLKLADSLKHDKAASISRVNCETYPSVCGGFGVKGYPTMLWIVDGKVVSQYDGTRTHADLKKFVADNVAEDKDMTDEVRSEDHVAHLTDTTFDKVTGQGVSFVMFMAPWCGHCKRLSPIIDDLAIKFAADEDVRIAKIDCSQFDSLCTSHGVDGYPTLFLYKSGVKVTEYEGERSLQDIYSFIHSHLEVKDEL